MRGNQPTLHDGIKQFFLKHLDDDIAEAQVSRHETIKRGHGREETRAYFVCAAPEQLPDRARWQGSTIPIGTAFALAEEGGF